MTDSKKGALHNPHIKKIILAVMFLYAVYAGALFVDLSPEMSATGFASIMQMPSLQQAPSETAEPVSYYKLDGNEMDSAGSNYGKLVGASYGEGKIGKAVSISAKGQYVTMGDPADLKMSEGLTVQAWIYPTGAGFGTGGSGGIIVNKEGEYEIARFSDGTIRYAIANTEPAWNWVNTKYVAPLNTWTNIAWTYSALEKSLKLYVNGDAKPISEIRGSGTIGDFSPTYNEFRIGGRQGLEQTFQGKIDDVRVFNKPVSIDDIACNIDGSKCSAKPIIGVPALPAPAFEWENPTGEAGIFNLGNPEELHNIRDQVTFEAWVTPHKFQKHQAVFQKMKEGSNNDNTASYMLYMGAHEEPGYTSFRPHIRTANGKWIYGQMTKAIAQGQKYHVVYSYDSKSGSITAYLNGEKVKLNPKYGPAQPGQIINDQPYPLFIGKDNRGAANFLGIVHSLRVWNTQLSDEQVQELYSPSIVIPPEPPATPVNYGESFEFSEKQPVVRIGQLTMRALGTADCKVPQCPPNTACPTPKCVQSLRVRVLNDAGYDFGETTLVQGVKQWVGAAPPSNAGHAVLELLGLDTENNRAKLVAYSYLVKANLNGKFDLLNNEVAEIYDSSERQKVADLYYESKNACISDEKCVPTINLALMRNDIVDYFPISLGQSIESDGFSVEFLDEVNGRAVLLVNEVPKAIQVVELDHPFTLAEGEKAGFEEFTFTYLNKNSICPGCAAGSRECPPCELSALVDISGVTWVASVGESYSLGGEFGYELRLLSLDPDGHAEFVLNIGEVSDIIEDRLQSGETRTYTLAGRDYEITVVRVDKQYADMRVNGEKPGADEIGEIDALSDGSLFGIHDIDLDPGEKEYTVEFFLGVTDRGNEILPGEQFTLNQNEKVSFHGYTLVYESSGGGSCPACQVGKPCPPCERSTYATVTFYTDDSGLTLDIYEGETQEFTPGYSLTLIGINSNMEATFVIDQQPQKNVGPAFIPLFGPLEGLGGIGLSGPGVVFYNPGEETIPPFQYCAALDFSLLREDGSTDYYLSPTLILGKEFLPNAESLYVLEIEKLLEKNGWNLNDYEGFGEHYSISISECQDLVVLNKVGVQSAMPTKQPPVADLTMLQGKLWK